MHNFSPYTITHTYLDQGNLFPVLNTKQGNYLVFWWKEIALGQLMIKPGDQVDEKEYFSRLEAAIEPALSFYCKQFGQQDDQWKPWLLTQNVMEWNTWMDNLFKLLEIAKIPETVPVSVIICTRNRATHLKNCLERLEQLLCKPQEIVVIDNAPSDESTQLVVKKFAGVKYICEPKGGLDIARNTGIQHASQPVVAFIDDDVLVHPMWVYRVWETFLNPSVAAMTGLVIAQELATEAQLIFEEHWSFNRGYVDKIYDTDYFKSTITKGTPVWEIGAGANMAFRKSVFALAGNFNELLDAGAAGCNGDSEMWFRILLHGQKILYNPRAVVYHEHRKDLPGLKKQLFAYMRGFTVAALMQHQQYKTSGYKKNIFKELPKYYLLLIRSGFPYYSFRYQTIWVEMKGIISGIKFFNKHKHVAQNHPIS